MQKKHWLILAALALSPLLLAAAKDASKSAPAAHEEAEDDDDEVAPEKEWGAKLGTTLTLSLWSSKDGEASATKIATSREVFASKFSMGKEGKGGFEAELGGRLYPRPDGSVELLLELEAKGGDPDKGAMALEIHASAILKKGQAVVIASTKDGQFLVKVE